MPKTQKKMLLFFLPLLLCLLAVSAFFLSGQADRHQLEKLESSLLQTAFSEDTLSLHFALSRPERFELSEEPASLPVYSKAANTESRLLLEKRKQELDRIHTAGLSEEECLRLKLLEEYLESEQTAASFPYYAEPLSPSSGAQSSLPVLLAEYTFREPADVEHYLDLLEQIPSYLDGLAVYEQEKAQAGLFMSDESAADVIEQCSAIMNADQLENGSHFLCQTFAERLDSLCEKGLLTQAEKEKYLSENNRLLTTVVAPAYERLADQLFLLAGSTPKTAGLSSLPQGKSYYEYLVARSTGSSRTIPEIKEMLTARLQEDFHALAALSASNQDLLSDRKVLSAMSSHTAALLPETPEEMLSDLRNQMDVSFPALTRNGEPVSDDYIDCQVKSVSDCLEPYVSPAYYFTPPADDVCSNTIYINHSQTPQGLQLYTTLAHEGYPGHLYQSVFFQLGEDDSEPPVRSLYYYGGYIEGWALYVEMLSYDFAQSTMQAVDPDDSLAAFTCKLERLDRDMQLCLYSLLDIAIHYDGASQEQIQEVLARFGLSAAASASLYRYIAEEPANYLKYYVGYLEILNCREYARQLWQEDYSDKAFHTFFLETGPCGFDLIREKIAEYTP